MNNEAFSKLKPEKQKRILNAAFNEFSLNTFDKVSVFQIAKNANISRASFYCYFEDKKDVYFYLLSKFKDELFGSIANTEENYDPFDISLKTFSVLAECKGTDMQPFIEKLLINMNPSAQNIFVPTVKMTDKAKQKIDFSKYPSVSGNEFVTLFDMLFYGLSRKLTYYYQNNISREQINKEFEKIIYYALHGVLREN